MKKSNIQKLQIEISDLLESRDTAHFEYRLRMQRGARLTHAYESRNKYRALDKQLITKLAELRGKKEG